MPRLLPSRRALNWLALAALLAIGAFWAYSIAWPFAWCPSRGNLIGFGGNAVWGLRSAPLKDSPGPGWYFADCDQRAITLFSTDDPNAVVVDQTGSAYFEFPLWPFFAATALIVIALWWVDLWLAPPGLCPHCRYDLRSLPAGSPCPECGARSPPPRE